MRLKNILNESDLKGYLAADVVDDIVKSIGSKFVSGEIKNAPNKNYIYLKLTDIKFGSGVVKMLKSQFGIDAKIDKTFGNIPSVSFASKKVVSESVNEGKYYIGYNKGRGQGTGVFKDVFSTYKDAKKELEKIEKQRGGSYNQIAYYVADKDGKFVRESVNEEKVYIDYLNKAKGFKQDRIKFNSYDEAVKWARKNFDKFSPDMIKYESVNEGREVKAIQSDFNKTVAAIETELLHYKKTKGTPQEKKHVDNLKKLHPIKKKLEAELESAVSGLYRDAELKIED